MNYGNFGNVDSALFRNFRPPSFTGLPASSTIVRPLLEHNARLTSTPVLNQSTHLNESFTDTPELLPDLPEPRFRFSQKLDVMMLKEILANHPFQHPPKTKLRAEKWSEVVQKINTPGATQRSIEDRFAHLKKAFLKKSSTYASGEAEPVSEVERLLQDVIDIEKEFSVKQKEATKQIQEKAKRAEDVRKRALEGMSKSDECRRNAKRQKQETFDFLVAKMEREFDFKEKELELRREELEFQKQQLQVYREVQENNTTLIMKRLDEQNALLLQSQQQMMKMLELFATRS